MVVTRSIDGIRIPADPWWVSVPVRYERMTLAKLRRAFVRTSGSATNFNHPDSPWASSYGGTPVFYPVVPKVPFLSQRFLGVR